MAAFITTDTFTTGIAINLDLRALQNVLRNAKLVIRSVYRKYRLGVGAEIFQQARPVQIVNSMLIRILDYGKDILDSPWDYTSLFTSFTMQRIRLSWLGWSKEDDGAVLSLDEGLDHGFHALPVELLLSLHLAEDIIEFKDVRVVAIRRTVLPIEMSQMC